MERQPPAPTLELGFVKGHQTRQEFQRLWHNCLATRDRGIEHRMDYGRALGEMRLFLKQYSEPQMENGFDIVCETLEITPADARLRIAMTNTWDVIREYLDDRGLPYRMPQSESHITSLFTEKDLTKRGEIWAKIYAQAIASETNITAKWMDQWILDYKALPLPAQLLKEEEPTNISFEEDQEPEPEVSQEQVPPDAKPAVAAPVPRGSPPLIQAKGQGPLFTHPPELQEAIERVAKICGGEDPERVKEWKAALNDPIKINFEDLLAWEKHTDVDVRKIGRLIHGDMDTGLRTAIRIVDRVIDGRTRLTELYHLCVADGGRWEHNDGQYRIIVTKLNQ